MRSPDISFASYTFYMFTCLSKRERGMRSLALGMALVVILELQMGERKMFLEQAKGEWEIFNEKIRC